MPLRVAFFGNSDSLFSNRHFYALLWTKCTVVAVVDVPPIKRASTNARPSFPVESFVVQASSRRIPAFEPETPNSAEFVATMRALTPDLFIAAGYMNLLKPEILAVPRLIAANWHASLLPAYRGKHPVFWALRNGERQVGLTVHIMGPGLDTGDILYQVKVRTRKNDTVGRAYDRIMSKSVPLVGRLIRDAEKGKLVARPQPDLGASYYSSVKEQDLLLDWSLDAETLRRRVQTSPGQCFCVLAGRQIHFLDAKVIKNPVAAGAGTLVRLGRESCVISAGESELCVRRVKVDDQEKTAAEAFRELGLVEGSTLAA